MPIWKIKILLIGIATSIKNFLLIYYGKKKFNYFHNVDVKDLKDNKKWHLCEEGQAHLRISVWHLLMNLKNNCLLKELWSGRIKNVRILIFITYFFKKNEGDIIILHLCTKNFDDMIYSSRVWQTEIGKFWVIFCPPPP